MSDDPSKCANYLRIIRLLVDVGTETVRTLLYKKKPKSDIIKFLESKKKTLSKLRRKRVLTQEQFETVTSHSHADDFDISLLITLLTNLFPWEEEAPKHGWRMEVEDSDVSLGADLMRLRKLRNNLVAHRQDARLSSEQFETLWEQIEKILIRIVIKTDVENVENVTSKIKEYKSSSLDDEQNYMTLFGRWYNEVVNSLSSLQDEFKEICKRIEDFSQIIKGKLPERYYRYVLLLQEVGRFVLEKILEMELNRVQGDLTNLLRKHQDNISFNEIFKEGNKIDTSTWGTRVLADVILVLFDKNLTEKQKGTIARMVEKCNDLPKAAIASLDSDTFTPYWTDIVTVINKLSFELDNEDTKDECERLIIQYGTKTVVEDVATRYCEQLQKDIMPDILNLHKEAKDKLKENVELIESEETCGAKIELDLEMTVHGNSKEKKEIAEKILYTVFKKALNKDQEEKDFEIVQSKVLALLRQIEDIPGVQPTNVEKGSVLLTLKCLGLDELLQLLDIIDTATFLNCVADIGKGLSDYLGEEIDVSTFFTVDSMQNAMAIISNRGEAGTNTSSISLELQCSNIDALDGLKHLMETREITDNFNAIAQSISEILDEKVSVDTSLKKHRIKVVISDPYLAQSESKIDPLFPNTDEAATGFPRPQIQTETKMQQNAQNMTILLSLNLDKGFCNEKSATSKVQDSESQILTKLIRQCSTAET